MSLRAVYHALKRNPVASAMMQAADVILPVTLAGQQMKTYRRIISNHWVRDGFESVARKSFRQIVKTTGAGNFFDIGANVGVYTIEFLSAVPAGKVVAAEPNERVFACLQRSCAGAGEGACTLRAAVSDRPGFADLHYDPMSPAMGGIVAGDDGLFNAERIYGARQVARRVAVTTLDAMAATYFVPDIIKIDVEGAEIMVFKGGARTIAEHPPALFFECTRDGKEIGDLLKSWGYVLFSETLQRIDDPQFATFALHSRRHGEAMVGRAFTLPIPRHKP